MTSEVGVDSVIGIDLSGLTSGARGRTVAVHLFLETPLRLGERFVAPRRLRGDRILVEWIDERRPRVIAIDAPLTLPHSILCADPRCMRCELGSAEYLARDVDRLASGMPTAMLAAIAFRGIYLARKLRERGYEVIETYPAASFRTMGAGSGPIDRAWALERRLGPLPPMTTDEFDATCAALVAGDYATGTAQAIERADGAIWMPRSDVMIIARDSGRSYDGDDGKAHTTRGDHARCQAAPRRVLLREAHRGPDP